MSLMYIQSAAVKRKHLKQTLNESDVIWSLEKRGNQTLNEGNFKENKGPTCLRFKLRWHNIDLTWAAGFLFGITKESS